MEALQMIKLLKEGSNIDFPLQAKERTYAENLELNPAFPHLRDRYIIPSKGDLELHSTEKNISEAASREDAVYLCGNSLGLQPRVTAKYLEAHLKTWSSLGVYGHSVHLPNSPLVEWSSLAEDAAKKSASIVGGFPSEIVIMNTLTANLHLMMASFYKPTPTRHKIILEKKAFPSDHYAIESQIHLRGYDASASMIIIDYDEDHIFSTSHILSVIDKHAAETALILLPGLQYYSGQALEIAPITRHAQSHGFIIGWDLAHAAGNIPLNLHDWNVDFACWCTYKYINAGPGAIAGAFIHERYGAVEYEDASGPPIYRDRLMGWYGGDKSVRFKMETRFIPTPGASGYQLSNPSAVDLASLCASLSVFEESSLSALRERSLVLTDYLGFLLGQSLQTLADVSPTPAFRIITPADPRHRGAQISVLLRPGLLRHVAQKLREAGIVVDSREPDVIRVAPVPMYNTFMDVWDFVDAFRHALVTGRNL